MSVDRLLSTNSAREDAMEGTLRLQNLADYRGQPAVHLFDRKYSGHYSAL